MRVLYNSILIPIVLFCLIIQTGCWDIKQYEQIGFILQMGFETTQDGKLLMSITAPVVAPEAEEKVEFYSTAAERLVRSSRNTISNEAGRLLQGGKIQHVYFSKELAGKGIGELLEIFLRDPENPLLANIVIVDGSPKDMVELSIKYKDKPRSAIYANWLLADARRRAAAPEMRVYSFTICEYSGTIDPVAPIVAYDDKSMKVKGAALFAEDRMVGEIDTDQTMLLNALLQNKGDFEYAYRGNVPDGTEPGIKKGAVFLVKGIKKKVKIATNGKVPEISINLKIDMTLIENLGAHDLDKSEKENMLEEVVAKAFQSDILKLLKHIQSVGSDPIGFGEMVRVKHNNYWKSVVWRNVYKDAVFNVEVETNLESYGTIK